MLLLYTDFLSYLCNLSGHQGWLHTDTVSVMVDLRRWGRGGQGSSEMFSGEAQIEELLPL